VARGIDGDDDVINSSELVADPQSSRSSLENLTDIEDSSHRQQHGSIHHHKVDDYYVQTEDIQKHANYLFATLKFENEGPFVEQI
jgi:hypothetical protein